MSNFPIKVKMKAAILQELHSCEYGSYEDHVERSGNRHWMVDSYEDHEVSEDGSRCGRYADGTLHIVEIIERSPHKTVVYLENQDEVDEFFGQALTGTFGLHHLQTALRLYRELVPHVSEAARKMVNPGNIGY